MILLLVNMILRVADLDEEMTSWLVLEVGYSLGKTFLNCCSGLE